MSKHLLSSILCSFFLFLATPGSIFGQQLTAHTAGFQRWCRATTLNPGPHLGGAPSATGGVPPYHYQWTCLTFTPTAPLFDNDTVANPQVQTWDFGFYMIIDVLLTVTDSAGAVAHDTARIHASGFAYSLNACEGEKTASDSIYLIPLITGGTYGCPPYSYLWTPNLYLSSDTAVYPLCGAPVNMKYTLHFTDSLGCTDTPSTPCYIYILPDAVSNTKSNDHNVSIYPNPLTTNSIISVPHEWTGSDIYLYAADGRLITKLPVKNENTPLGSECYNLPYGLLFYKIKSVNGVTLATGKVVR